MNFFKGDCEYKKAPIFNKSGGKWRKVDFCFYFYSVITKNKLLNLHGEYECTLDAKGRLIVPAALKKQLPAEAKDAFFINRGFEKCCVLYPANEWDNIAGEINKLSDYIKKEREFKRYFLRGASRLEMDTASRILLPKPLQEYAGLNGGELVLLAYGNKIEVWSKAEYDNMLSAEPEDFSALAEEVMTKKKNEEQ